MPLKIGDDVYVKAKITGLGNQEREIEWQYADLRVDDQQLFTTNVRNLIPSSDLAPVKPEKPADDTAGGKKK